MSQAGGVGNGEIFVGATSGIICTLGGPVCTLGGAICTLGEGHAPSEGQLFLSTGQAIVMA